MQERLQKIIASAGLASRRAAEKMILDGEVTLNGRRVTELGVKADPQSDYIKVRGKLIDPHRSESEKRYILLNKPKGYLSSLSDPKKRPLVTQLVPSSARRGLHPVGRLDFNTEGLIILTNDGKLTLLLTQGGAVEKVYHVKVKGSPGQEQIDRLGRGIRLEDKRTAPARIKVIERTREGGNTWYEVTLTEGKNQQIRRMFDSIGHSVVKLRRVRIGHLTDRGLTVGAHRDLKPAEITRFYNAATRPKASTRRPRLQRR